MPGFRRVARAAPSMGEAMVRDSTGSIVAHATSGRADQLTRRARPRIAVRVAVATALVGLATAHGVVARTQPPRGAADGDAWIDGHDTSRR